MRLVELERFREILGDVLDQHAEPAADDFPLRLQLIDDLAVLDAHRFDPILGAHVDEILGPRAVTGECQRMRDEAGALQPLVHRSQVVLRAAEPVDQEDTGLIRHAESPQ